MLRPDCICVWIFSTTSPSWIMSCLTLMPVISVNALASVFDSYSCVVIVSETTLISMPAKGFGGIDEPLHLLHLLVLATASRAGTRCRPSLLRRRPCRRRPRAASIIARGGRAGAAEVHALATSSLFLPSHGVSIRLYRSALSAGTSRFAPQTQRNTAARVDERQDARPTRVRRPHEPEPGEMDEGGAEQADEQPVAARRRRCAGCRRVGVSGRQAASSVMTTGAAQR